MGRKGAEHTVGRVLLGYTHDTNHTRLFTIRVVEEGLVALSHPPQVVPRDIVPNTCAFRQSLAPHSHRKVQDDEPTLPALGRLLGSQIINGELNLIPVLDANIRLRLHEPVPRARRIPWLRLGVDVRDGRIAKGIEFVLCLLWRRFLLPCRRLLFMHE